jgi:hypothetical protein
MLNTLRGLDFFASLQLTILGRPANFEFFEQSASGRPRSGLLISKFSAR